MRILLIEDDGPIARVVRRGLEKADYQVDLAVDGREGLRLASESSYALVILDLMLPGLNGWRICEELRDRKVRVPILMLSAKASIDDKVRGLDLGADDYLPKPFEFPELLARVRALIRRDRVCKSRIIRIADLVIDTSERRVIRSGTVIPLSRREFDLLEALAAHEGRVLTREVIQERIWQDDESYSNTVDVYIGLLRKKVDAGYEPKLLQTVRGVGYTLRRPDPEPED